MNTSLHKLSLSAAQLLQQKSVLTIREFNNKMEDILFHLANITSDTPKHFSHEIGLLEKMSFEIRTPMNSILGFTGLLKDSYFTMEEKDEFIDLIEQNTSQLVELLSDLAELTKIENLQINLRMEKFELKVFLINIISAFKQELKNKNNQIIKNINETLPVDLCIYTDPYQLKKIIQMLLTNLSRLNDRVNIELSADIVEKQILEIKIVSDQLELPERLSRSIKKHIKEPQEQSSFDGTGLKLTIIKALVDLLNGELEFKSIQPIGSEFVLHIPVKVL